MKSLVNSLLSFVVLFRLWLFVHAAPPLAQTNSASELNLLAPNSSCGVDAPVPNLKNVHDPYQARVPGTATQVIFSGFTNPHTKIDAADFFYVGYKAQSDIVRNVIRNRGDGPIAQPNLRWDRYKTALTINHKLDNELTWSTLSQAVEGVINFGWDVGFLTVKQITILDDVLGIVGTGGLTYGQDGAMANGTLTS